MKELGWIYPKCKDGTTHVIPRDDLKGHNWPGMNCWCRPYDDGDAVIVHNSMDRREEYETYGRKMS